MISERELGARGTRTGGGDLRRVPHFGMFDSSTKQ